MKELSNHSFFLRRTKKLLLVLEYYQALLTKNRTQRLVLGLIIIGLISGPTLLGFQSTPMVLMGFGLIAAWLVLFLKTKKLKWHVVQAQALFDFYKRQELRKKGTYSEDVKRYESVAKLTDKTQPRTLDLDLFGQRSLMAHMDETFSKDGHKHLSEQFLNIQSVSLAKKRIEIVNETLHLAGAFRKCMRIGSPRDIPIDFLMVQKSIENPYFKKRDFFFLVLLGGLLALNLSLFFYWIKTHEAGLLNYTLTGYIAIMLFSVQILGRTYDRSQDLLIQMERLSPLFEFLESEALNSRLHPILKKTRRTKPGSNLRKLERQLQFLSIEANPFVFFAVNAIVPWHHFFSWRSERIRNHIEKNLSEIFEELKEFEVIQSFVFLKKYQNTSQVEWTELPQLVTENLYHPMIDQTKCSTYSFELGPAKTLALITGSNMSGKSTFLRTVGLNFLLAQMGAPVFAKRLSIFSGDLASCIRVSDSLQDGYSYFYAEVKRVSQVLRNCKNGSSLYLLDELFKGTNQEERVQGAKATLLALLETQSLGFVTSHDRELNMIFRDHPKVRLFHFSEKVENDQLTFDHLLRDGPSQTTNALLIMRHQGLPV